ncbi:MAG: acetylglutamate kinase [Planctomycetota bacterium]|nr:MAG: acetylglutamate kinase [Planctomycetota bacterium]
MQEAIGKAATLIEALPYIREYYEKIVVVKLGGSVMDDPDAERELLRDVVFMNYVGMQPIIVHGGGNEISRAMDEAGLEPNFVQGLRYTDERTLAIAERILCGRINKRIVETLKSFGVEAIGLNSLTSCVLFAERTYLEGPDNRRIDIGLVGKIERVSKKVLQLLCKADTIPVIAPIALDASGGKLNVNADTVAGVVAAAVKAEKLVMVSDTHGIRTKRDDPESFRPSLNRQEIAEFMGQGIIGKGMIPKVEACIQALDAGSRKAHIIDGRITHSLLLEIFTDKGVGTQILP